MKGEREEEGRGEMRSPETPVSSPAGREGGWEGGGGGTEDKVSSVGQCGELAMVWTCMGRLEV